MFLDKTITCIETGWNCTFLEKNATHIENTLNSNWSRSFPMISATHIENQLELHIFLGKSATRIKKISWIHKNK